jgi:hypothetical protein
MYGNNEKKEWILCASPSRAGCLNFTYFDLQTNYDFFNVFNATDNSAIASYSGNTLPNTSYFLAPVKLQFTSDQSVPSLGFRAEVCIAPRKCQPLFSCNYSDVTL